MADEKVNHGSKCSDQHHREPQSVETNIDCEKCDLDCDGFLSYLKNLPNDIL